MKQSRREFRRIAIALFFSASILTGCQKEKEPKPPEPIQAEEPEKEQQNIVDGKDNVEITGTIEGLTYTSADGRISITLPNESWQCESDAEGSATFISDEGLISIVRMDGVETVQSSIYHSPEEYVSYLKGTSPSMEGEVVSFVNASENGADTFHAVYHYTGESEYKYAVSGGVGFEDHCYIISARMMTEDENALNEVINSVYHCKIEK